MSPWYPSPAGSNLTIHDDVLYNVINCLHTEVKTLGLYVFRSNRFFPSHLQLQITAKWLFLNLTLIYQSFFGPLSTPFTLVAYQTFFLNSRALSCRLRLIA